eukprot:4100820-Amphidinium_carterae.1
MHPPQCHNTLPSDLGTSIQVWSTRGVSSSKLFFGLQGNAQWSRTKGLISWTMGDDHVGYDEAAA